MKECKAVGDNVSGNAQLLEITNGDLLLIYFWYLGYAPSNATSNRT